MTISDVRRRDWLHTEQGNLGEFCLAFERYPEKESVNFCTIWAEFLADLP